MAAEGMQSHDQSCGNCPTASHPATKKGRINAPILPKPARCAKSDRLLEFAPGRGVANLCALVGIKSDGARSRARRKDGPPLIFVSNVSYHYADCYYDA